MRNPPSARGHALCRQCMREYDYTIFYHIQTGCQVLMNLTALFIPLIRSRNIHLPGCCLRVPLMGWDAAGIGWLEA